MLFYVVYYYDVQKRVQSYSKLFNFSWKLQKKCVTGTENTQNIVLQLQNNGSAVHALGALMRMDLATVGAILSVVTGVFTRAEGISAP